MELSRKSAVKTGEVGARLPGELSPVQRRAVGITPKPSAAETLVSGGNTPGQACTMNQGARTFRENNLRAMPKHSETSILIPENAHGHVQ